MFAVEHFAGIFAGTIGIDHCGHGKTIASANQAVSDFAIGCFEQAVGKNDGRTFHFVRVPSESVVVLHAYRQWAGGPPEHLRAGANSNRCAHEAV